MKGTGVGESLWHEQSKVSPRPTDLLIVLATANMRGRPIPMQGRKPGYLCAGLLSASLLFLIAESASAQPVCTVRQITHSTGLAQTFPVINAAGTRIAFGSPHDLTGENPAHNGQLFLFDTTTGTLSQITHGTNGNSGGPSLSADGSRIAFVSDADLTGGNPVEALKYSCSTRRQAK
jgi:hypothetical protein